MLKEVEIKKNIKANIFLNYIWKEAEKIKVLNNEI